MSQIILKNLLGVNSSRAAMAIKAGEVSHAQNIRQRPLLNWHKRQGVEHVQSYDSPIMGIFDTELDEVIVPCVMVGGQLTFFPRTVGTGQGEPNINNDTPTTNDGGNFTLYLIEDAMRGVQERLAIVGYGKIDFPASNYDENGQRSSPVAAAKHNVSRYNSDLDELRDFPVNNFYKHDLFWSDQDNVDPVGTYAASLVQLIYNAVQTLCPGNGYLWFRGDLEGVGSHDFDYEEYYFSELYYNTVIAPNAPTAATWQSSLVFIKDIIRKMYRFNPSIILGAGDYAGFNNIIGRKCSADAVTEIDTVNSIAKVNLEKGIVTDGNANDYTYNEGTSMWSLSAPAFSSPYPSIFQNGYELSYHTDRDLHKYFAEVSISNSTIRVTTTQYPLNRGAVELYASVEVTGTPELIPSPTWSEWTSDVVPFDGCYHKFTNEVPIMGEDFIGTRLYGPQSRDLPQAIPTTVFNGTTGGIYAQMFLVVLLNPEIQNLR